MRLARCQAYKKQAEKGLRGQEELSARGSYSFRRGICLGEGTVRECRCRRHSKAAGLS
jgi:hypothetical protein